MMALTRRKKILIPMVLGILLAGVVGAALYLRSAGAPAGSDSGTAASSPPATEGGGVVLAANGTQQASGAPADAKNKKGDEKAKAPVPVSVTSIVSGPVSSYITSTGNLVAENEVKVLAEAEGRVAELMVEEGNHVARGQVLATLAHEDAEILMRKAEMRSANAALAHGRAVKAVAEELLSREDYEKLTMENSIAQQELAEAKWRLEKTTIRAPFAGHITERNLKLGQHVRPGDTLFTVADFDPLISRIYLPEKDVYGLSEGREVRITLKANEATRFTGRIRQISPVVDTATGTVKLTVEAMKTPSEVRPGAFVTIDIVRETHAAAVLLPRDAVIRELQDAYVFVARGEVAEKRTISLGLEEGDRVEAISGVEPGDQVIVAGQGGLKDGSPIKIIPTTQASDLAVRKTRPARG
jgi:membrane fusion protein (multidrug efflux system)